MGTIYLILAIVAIVILAATSLCVIVYAHVKTDVNQKVSVTLEVGPTVPTRLNSLSRCNRSGRRILYRSDDPRSQQDR